MRGIGLIGVVVAGLVALAAAVIGFNVGLGANVATNGTVVARPYWGFGFFHPFFGLLFGILFLVLIFALIRRAVWGGHGHGWGQNGWYGPGGPSRQTREEMLERWHRQAHGNQQDASTSNAQDSGHLPTDS
jgi:hypothetical protein